MLNKIKNKLFPPTKIQKMYSGFFETCSEVAKSMGAEGALAVINPVEFQNPTVTKDGVTICRNIFFNDNIKNLGSHFAKQAAAKTLVKSGDGTTTTLVFAQDIVKNTKRGLFFKSYKYNSKVKEGIERAQQEVEDHLSVLSEKTTEESIYSIAKISSNNNEEIGRLVADAYISAGANGIIDVQQNFESDEITMKLSSGMRLDKGLRSFFLINNESNGSWSGNDVNILVYEGNIGLDNANEIAKFLSDKAKEPILIICEHISEEVLSNIEKNHQQGKLDICVIECPFFAEQRKMMLQDIALYTNTEVFIQGVSENYKWGTANKVTVTESSTSIIQDIPSEAVAERSTQLKEQLKTSTEKDFLKKRISNLEGKSAVILVGGLTDISRKEKFDRVEDSVCAVRSAVEEGTVTGGGSALVFISTLLKTKFANKDVQFGYNALKKSLLAPYKTILGNAKVNYKKFIGASKKEYGTGYNVKAHAVQNLEKTGVVDSVKSIRVALENAVSVGVQMLHTEIIIAPEQND